ncbi:HEAT repeat domain-containing protein [Salinilacihabitans rarus]|uniref:HEAT repeat domain-containing protein n=1 Tax=Salinilacihabitans rarus TaxID=2961596 RepID=UPI0020C8D2B5|nr:HEAT repeat domain-containing protein [Salinilacihabitans rarus]
MSDEETDESGSEAVDVEATSERLGGLEAGLKPVRERLGPIREDLAAVEDRLDAAETEDDLDEVEAALEPVREDVEDVREAFDERRAELDEIELPEPPAADEEDEEPEDPFADIRAEREAVEESFDEVDSGIGDLEDGVDDVESGVEDQRGPYAEDVVSEVESASSTITTTRWTVEGDDELIAAVDSFLADVNDLLGSDVSTPGDLQPASGAELGENADDEGDVPDRLAATLEEVTAAVEAADLDPDEDAETIAALLEATDDLQSDVDDATAWTDLSVREQLRREGFYDVLDHVKDYPPEWHALKIHEKRGDVDMILLAYEKLDSGFMEEHCLEALERMGPEEAIEPMLQQANRRDKTAISILGKIGVADENVVETLVDYVDATNDPLLQQTTFRALGEIGAEEAVEPIAQQLVAENADVRSSAARALGLLGDTRAIAPLTDVLADDGEDTVRASAAWALNQIGTEEALEPLADYVDDAAYLVQAEAERADLEPAA